MCQFLNQSLWLKEYHDFGVSLGLLILESIVQLSMVNCCPKIGKFQKETIHKS
jgi:hypothetical protein